MTSTPDVAEFELSKENILPIQQGRKAEVLRLALAVQPEDKLLKQRRLYEQELRSYSGDDPLSIWCSYIKWVEQNYPKGGREGNIGKLIQQCLLILKDEKQYHNDDRFIDIWIKFANLSVRPTEVYSNMFSRGIGCQSSRFYIAWAWEEEQLGNMKQADEILVEGIRRNAQPKELLKSAHSELEVRLAQSFANSEEKVNFENDQRSAFTMLKAQAKNKAPISRIGDATIPTNNQKLIINKQQKPVLKNSQKKLPFKIYDEDNKTSSLPVQTEKENFAIYSESKKENEKKLSKWSKVKVHQAAAQQAKAQEFTVHCDNTPQPESAKKLPQLTKVLTARPDAWAPAVALFEPPNPKVRPMYDKIKVYGGGEEFSFEELMAIKWFENQKKSKEQQKQKLEEMEKIELKNKLKQLQEKMEYLEALAVPVLQKQTNPTVNNVLNSIENISAHKIPQSVIEPRKKLQEVNNELQNSAAKTSSPCLIESNKQVNVFSGEMPSVLQKIADPVLEKPNSKTTCMTDQVDCMMRELYNGTLAINTELDDLSFDINNIVENDINLGEKDDHLNENFPLKDLMNEKKSEETKPFTIFCDPTEALPVATNIPIYHDPVNIYSEDIAPSSNKLQKEEKSENFIQDENLLENEENIPPSGYVQPINERELSGILQPSKNIYFVPLEKQLELEEEEADDDLEGIRPLDDNVTLLTQEQFAADACYMSTPCIKPQSVGIRGTVEKMETTVTKNNLPSELNGEVGLLKQLITDAINLADSEKIKELLKQISLEVTKKKNINYLIVLERLKLCHEISRDQNLKSLTKHCVFLIETYVEKNKDLNQTNLISNSHTLQLSTIMEASRESKSSSSSSSISLKQKSLSSTHSMTKIGKTSFYHSKSKDQSICEKEEENYLINQSTVDLMNPEITSELLKALKTPVKENFYECRNEDFDIQNGTSVKLGNIECYVEGLLTENGNTKVYSAQPMNSSFINFDQTLVPTSKLAIYVSDKVNEWEFYICTELQLRLANENIIPDIKNSFMEIKSAVAFQNCLVLISDPFEYGTLADIANMFKLQNQSSPEFLIMYFALEMLYIMSGLHKVGIIHGDVKPSNFVLNEIPNITNIESFLENPNCLRLISFRQAIDLRLLKPGVTFAAKVDAYQCPQAKERSWVFENDWYGVLNCIHILLFSTDMEICRNSDNQWELVQKFSHTSQTDIWQSLFKTFLNIPSCYQIPESIQLINMIKERLQKQMKSLKRQIFQFKLSFKHKS